MTKTFKSPLPDSSYKFEIGKNVGAEHLFAWISGGGADSISMALAPADAPALALAVLEAAGYVANSADVGVQPGESCDDHFWDAAEILRAGIAIQAETEAKEWAELEAEALELFRAFQHVRADGVFVSVPSFTSLSEPQQAEWLAVARRAREMRAEK